MTTASKVQWLLQGDYFQTCNCDYGCPCEFEAPPTTGFCEGVDVWRIARGRHGGVSLDGLAFGVAFHWPGPLHKGNGTVLPFVDERANARQREAILAIASGQAGGQPFETIAQLVSKVLDPQFVPFHFEGRANHRAVRLGNVASMAFEPIKNPVTGDPEKIRVDHATGFLFKRAAAVSAKEARCKAPGLPISIADKAGFLARFKYGN